MIETALNRSLPRAELLLEKLKKVAVEADGRGSSSNLHENGYQVAKMLSDGGSMMANRASP
jgi:hypothetical protein